MTKEAPSKVKIFGISLQMKYPKTIAKTKLKYLSLVFAIIFGYFIWSEVPKILTLLGASLVIASSLIIFMRENKLKKQIIAPRT